MLVRHGLRSLSQSARPQHGYKTFGHELLRRDLHYDGRNRLSNFWTPTESRKDNQTGAEDGHDLLVRAGFLRQAHSGIFHLLPLGLRVQDKIERLIDKHMQSLGASKVSLSSLSSQDLWQRSGRLDSRNSEFFKLQDRRNAKYLLSPTHEEEITNIVANAVHSYKELPLRLYQVSRKYRDEARPRQGLLRGREFIMKDLYTFDATEQQAMETYEDVRKAYRAFLDELGLPYLVASADSGNMGGNHSHEYHFVSPRGEDKVISCQRCGFSTNEELYRGAITSEGEITSAETRILYGRASTAPENVAGGPVSNVISICLPRNNREINIHALKDIVPELDTRIPLSDEAPADVEASVVLCDPRTARESAQNHNVNMVVASFLLTQAKSGDHCPQCNAESLQVDQAIEIGHTFHLGTRYSKSLGAKVLDADNKEETVSMGCHGLGVSRVIGAAASLLADARGLNWPFAIAPYGAVILGAATTSTDDVNAVYDQIVNGGKSCGLDAIVDDRERPLGWRLKDADLIGYPFIIVLGKSWTQRKNVEVQCRRLGLKEDVPVEALVQRIQDSIHRLDM